MMNAIKAASYLATIIKFVRKIYEKATFADTEGIRIKSNDDSGCWNVMVGNEAVAYKFDKAASLNMALECVRHCPSVAKRIWLLEDDELEMATETALMRNVPGISPADARYLSLLEF